MNTQKLLLGTLVGTIAVFALDSLIYAVLLKDTFTMVPGFHRETPDWLWLIIGYVVSMALFTYIYGNGTDSGATRVQQGMRYGIFIGLLIGFGLNLIWYSLQMASPLSEFLIDGVVTTVKYAIIGIVVALTVGVPDGIPAGGKTEGGGGGGGA